MKIKLRDIPSGIPHVYTDNMHEFLLISVLHRVNNKIHMEVCRDDKFSAESYPIKEYTEDKIVNDFYVVAKELFPRAALYHAKVPT